jgi:predicted esterase YcpF (UPF0227 family)
MKNRILYLHGFRSSPASFKGRMMEQALAERGLSHIWAAPQLPASPKAAIELALDLAQDQLKDSDGPNGDPSKLTLIGSSLGGYYATWLAEELGCKTILLNPAVQAARDLTPAVGEHRMYHSDAPFTFLPEYLDELTALHVDTLTRPQRYFLVAATGDEVLDWREMRDRYAGCRQHIVQGSDHGLSNFAELLPEVLAFALE